MDQPTADLLVAWYEHLEKQVRDFMELIPPQGDNARTWSPRLASIIMGTIPSKHGGMENLHKQVQVKVNAFVDEGVVSLVEALNDIDGILTAESCEEWCGKDPCVLFTYGPTRDWIRFAEVCSQIAARIRDLNAGFDCQVSVEWHGNNDHPWGRVIVDRAGVDQVAGAIKMLASDCPSS